MAPRLVECERPLGQRANDGPVDQKVGVIQAPCGNRDSERGRGPVQKLDVFLCGPCKCAGEMGLQRLWISGSNAIRFAAYGVNKGAVFAHKRIPFGAAHRPAAAHIEHDFKL